MNNMAESSLQSTSGSQIASRKAMLSITYDQHCTLQIYIATIIEYFINWRMMGLSWLLAYTCRNFMIIWRRILQCRRPKHINRTPRIKRGHLIDAIFSVNPPAINLLNWCINNKLIRGNVGKYWDYVEEIVDNDELVEFGIKAGFAKHQEAYVYLRMAKPGHMQEAIDKGYQLGYYKIKPHTYTTWNDSIKLISKKHNIRFILHG